MRLRFGSAIEIENERDESVNVKFGMWKVQMVG